MARKHLSFGMMRVFQLCIGQGMVRALGFGMRIWLARTVSEEAIGIFELACSCAMLLLSPLASGLPLATSRLTAQYLRENDSSRVSSVLRSAVMLALAGALCVSIPCALIAKPLANMLGDSRAWAPLMTMLPSILPLAVCGVLHGAMYGRGSAMPGVLQLVEQSTRLITAILLVYAFIDMEPIAHASILGVAASVGAIASLLLSIVASEGLFGWRDTRSKRRSAATGFSPQAGDPHVSPRAMLRKVASSAWPMSVSRMATAGLRSINQMLLPTYLGVAGLMRADAMSSLGVVAGMVMPMLFLPGVIIGPLCTFAMPRIAASAAGRKPRADVRALSIRCVLYAASISAGCAVLVGIAGPWLGNALYHNALSGQMLRFMSPMIVVSSMCQILSALLQGIARERISMRWQLASSAISCITMAFTCTQPGIGIYGFGISMMVGHAIGALGMAASLIRGIRSQPA